MTNQPLVVEEEFTTTTIFGLEQEVSVGVVSRATTRAASTLALLAWTRAPRDPQPSEDLPPGEQQEEGGGEETAKAEELATEELKLNLGSGSSEDSPDEGPAAN